MTALGALSTRTIRVASPPLIWIAPWDELWLRLSREICVWISHQCYLVHRALSFRPWFHVAMRSCIFLFCDALANDLAWLSLAALSCGTWDRILFSLLRLHNFALRYVRLMQCFKRRLYPIGSSLSFLSCKGLHSHALLVLKEALYLYFLLRWRYHQMRLVWIVFSVRIYLPIQARISLVCEFYFTSRLLLAVKLQYRLLIGWDLLSNVTNLVVFTEVHSWTLHNVCEDLRAQFIHHELLVLIVLTLPLHNKIARCATALRRNGASPRVHHVAPLFLYIHVAVFCHHFCLGEIAGWVWLLIRLLSGLISRN